MVPNSDRCRLKPGAIPKFQGNYLKENNDHNYSKLHVDKRALKLNRMKNSVRSLKQMGQFINWNISIGFHFCILTDLRVAEN